MKVHLSFDTEVWCDGWEQLDEKFPSAFQQYIYGPGGTGALPLTLAILKEHGLRGVFFVEPLFSLRFGLAPLQEIVGLIRDAGQDIQLHVHPEWVSELGDHVMAHRAKTPNLHAFSFEEQSSIIAAACERLQEAGAQRPTAFRAGSYAIDENTLRALVCNDIHIDSSINPVYDYPYPVLPDWQGLAPKKICGVLEYPVTRFRDGLGRWRPLHVTACSLAEMTGVLQQARLGGMSAVTLVSHNFELLTPSKQAVDPLMRRRFDGLCKWLSRHRQDFTTASYAPGLPGQAAVEPMLSASLLHTGGRITAQLARRAYR